MKFDSFFAMLSHMARLCPDSPALIFEEGGKKEQISFSSLCALVEERSKLFEEGTSLGIVCDGSKECVIEIFAAAKAGVQITLLDEAATQEQINSADVNTFFDPFSLLDDLVPNKTSKPSAKGKILFFTSGTTSANKAVVLSEKSLMASAFNGSSLLPLQKTDTLMCMLPLSHVFGFVCGLLWGLSCGAAVALGRGKRHYFDDLSFFRPTVLSAVPMLLGFLFKSKLFNPELKLVLIGAGGCSKELIEAVKSTGIKVSFGYGLTETSSGVALSLFDDPYAMTICPESKIEIASDGEILITAPTCVMEGYYKNDASTAEVLKNGVLFSGDIGEIKNGFLFITGRKKEIITLKNGTKIFLPEYEKKLEPLLEGLEFAVLEQNGEVVLAVHGDFEDDLLQKIAPAMKDLPISQRIKSIIPVSSPFERTETGKIKRWKLQQIAGVK